MVPLPTPDLVARVQQNFRTQFLKDAVLLRQLDEATMGMLTHTVFFNNMTLVNQLSQDEDFLRDLFTTMLSPPETTGQLDLLAACQSFSPFRSLT